MSGRKCSQVELDAARTTALENGHRAIEAAGRCEAQIAEFESALKAEKDFPALFRELLVQLHQAAAEAREQCNAAQETLRSASLSIEAVEHEQRQIDVYSSRLDALNRRAATCLSGLGVEVRSEAFRARIDSERERFRMWDPVRYDGVTSGVRSFKDDLRNTLCRGAGVEGLGERLERISREWDELVTDIAQRERKNRRREMVIEAVRSCCSRLGYTSERRQEVDPNKPVQLVVDTQLYGEILFTLEMDGLLRSHSDAWLDEQQTVFVGPEAEQAPCKHWVSELSEKMKANYGMSLEFHFADSQQPVDESQTAKGLSISGRQVRAQADTGQTH